MSRHSLGWKSAVAFLLSILGGAVATLWYLELECEPPSDRLLYRVVLDYIESPANGPRGFHDSDPIPVRNAGPSRAASDVNDLHKPAPPMRTEFAAVLHGRDFALVEVLFVAPHGGVHPRVFLLEPDGARWRVRSVRRRGDWPDGCRISGGRI